MDKMETNQKKKKKKHRKWLITLIIVLILLLGIAGTIVYFISKVNTVPLNMENVKINAFDNKDVEEYTNIALFGVDSRESDLTAATRSDTIIICSINNKTKEVKLASVYRDTLASINDSVGKINSAYAKGGYELAISTLNTHFDLDIKDFVTVNFASVTNVVNKIGGIEIKVESDEINAFNKNIKDCNNLMNTHSPLIKSAGTYTLDGTQALAYARIRKTAGNDFRRTERQRTVIGEILKKAKKTNIVTLVGIINDMLPQIATSFSSTDIISLAKDVASYSIADQTGLPFKYRNATVHGGAVLVPNTLTSNVTELHKFLFATENYTPSSTVQSISNTLSKY